MPLLDLKGARVTLSDFQGKVVLLSFWDAVCEQAGFDLFRVRTDDA